MGMPMDYKVFLVSHSVDYHIRTAMYCPFCPGRTRPKKRAMLQKWFHWLYRAQDSFWLNSHMVVWTRSSEGSTQLVSCLLAGELLEFYPEPGQLISMTWTQPVTENGFRLFSWGLQGLPLSYHFIKERLAPGRRVHTVDGTGRDGCAMVTRNDCSCDKSFGEKKMNTSWRVNSEGFVAQLNLSMHMAP